MQRRPRKVDEAHRAFIRELPCLLCLDDTGTDPAHIRMSDARIGKLNAGIGAKPDDRFTLPLCRECHTEQHSMGERQFWDKRGVDPVLMALALYSVTGEHEEAERMLRTRHVNVLAAG